MSKKKKKKKSKKGKNEPFNLSEIKEFALQQYRENSGEKIKGIADKIWSRFEFKVTKTKIKQWCDEGGWEEVLSQSRDLARTMQPHEKSFKRAMFEAFRDRKVAYENYFKTIQDGKMDNNAHWAYKDILTKLDSLQEALEQEKALSQTEKHQRDGESMGEIFGFNY